MTTEENTDAWIFDKKGNRIKAQLPAQVAEQLYDEWHQQPEKVAAFKTKDGKIKARDIWVQQDIPPSANDEWQPN